MLVSGGKILALGKIKYNNGTDGQLGLSGEGWSGSPLGLTNVDKYKTWDETSAWVINEIVSASIDPYEAGNQYIRIDDKHKVYGYDWTSAINPKMNTSSFNAWSAHAFDPYALTSAVNQKFNETSSWANGTFQPKGDYATKTDVSNASAAAVNSADGIIKYWVQHNYWTSGDTQRVMEEMLANFGGYEFTQAGTDGKPVLPAGEEPSNKKIYLTENTSAVGLDRYFNWIYDTSTHDFTCVGDTSVNLDGYAKTDWVNGELNKKVNSDDFDAYSADIATTLAGKLNKDDFDTWSADAFNDYAKTDDVNTKFEETSAWAEKTFQPSGDYVSATDFAKLTQDVNGLSADFGDYKTEVEHKFVETSSWAEGAFQPKGNYVSAEPFNTWADGVDDALDTINDNFQSISADLETISAGLEKKLDTEDFEAWQEGKDFTSYSAGEGIDVQNHLISLASSALDNYYKKNETSAASAISAEFAKYQPAGEYITSADADERYLPMDWSAGKDVTEYSAGDNYIKVQDHKIYLESAPVLVSVSSTDGSVDVTEVPTEEGITYDLSVKPVDETIISGENGVSAKYDEDEKAWLIGLTNYREKASWGQVTSDYTTYVSGSEKIINLNAPTIVGNDIAISTGGDITLGEGLYHIDAQIDINVPAENIAANYYDVLFTIGNRSTIHELDASYTHAETVNLSFDIKVGASAVPIAMYIAQLPVGAQYKVRNFNIHEVVTIDALIEGGLQDTYDAGVGIQKYIDPTTSNPTFSAKIGLGLSADANGFFNVACGSGLKIDAQGGVMAVTLDEVTEEVVNTVTELKGDLDTKVTVNFDYSNIDDSYSFEGIGSTTGQGVLLGYLFAVPINAKVYTDDDAASEYETLIGIYSKQQYTQNYVMFGLYEYDPSYPQWNPTHTEISGYGRTVPLCDTGAVKLKAGFNEFPVKHVNNKGETSPELKSSCLYYATLYVSKNPGGGIMLAGCPGYKTTFNTIPQITLDQANVNYDLSTMSPEERAAWSYNDMGWGSWGGTENYHELPSAPRFFMQVRNKKKDTTV